MRTATHLLLALMSFSVLAGCAGQQIPNTTVSDTPENREVVEFMETYRHAVEERDVGRLMTLASPMYLDHNGTPVGRDDHDFDTLREKLTRWAAGVLDVRYEIRYRRVTRSTSRVFIEYRYSASYRIEVPGGEERWSRRIGDNRMVLALDEDSGEFSILSGM